MIQGPDPEHRADLLGLFGVPDTGEPTESAAIASPDGKPGRLSLDDLASKVGEGARLSGHEAELAQRVGADPAAVRVHRGPEADLAAAQRQATAFTIGNHIVLASRAPAPGTAEGDDLFLHEAAHVAQQQDAARDPIQRAKPIGNEDHAAERDADRAANHGSAPTGGGGQTGLQLQRWPADLPAQTPKNVGTRSVADKAAFIRKSMADAGEGWGRVVVDVFEQTDPGARIMLQRQLDMEQIVKAMPAFEATHLGTLGPLTAGQATLNHKRVEYIEQVTNDFGDRAEVFVLFAFRGVYDDDAYTIFAELANRRTLHKLLAMPDVAKQIKARGLKTDGFAEPGTGFLGGVREGLGGLGAGLKHAVKDDRTAKYGSQKDQLPPEYAGALSQMEMAEFEGNLTLKNTAIGAIDQVTFGVPHGVVDLGRSTIGAIGNIAHGEYRAAGEQLSGAAVVLLTHLGVKAWRVISSVKPPAPSPGAGAKPAEHGPGVQGPPGPGQFVIPGFEGPISAEEAKLGAIFELNPEAQAAMGRLIARVGRAGVEKLAGFVQANHRAALFVAEHGEAGAYALLEAQGDAAVAGTKLPRRQLAAESTRPAAAANEAGGEKAIVDKERGERSRGDLAAEAQAPHQGTSYQFVEITNVNGVPIGEFDVVIHDGVATDRFIEDKSAHGLKHPKNRRTPAEWAQRQIFDKTNTRIKNLGDAVSARPRPDGLGSPSVPTLDQLRTIREFEFVVESADAEVRAAVDAQIVNLRTQYPGFRFKTRFGK